MLSRPNPNDSPAERRHGMSKSSVNLCQIIESGSCELSSKVQLNMARGHSHWGTPPDSSIFSDYTNSNPFQLNCRCSLSSPENYGEEKPRKTVKSISQIETINGIRMAPGTRRDRKIMLTSTTLAGLRLSSLDNNPL